MNSFLKNLIPSRFISGINPKTGIASNALRDQYISDPDFPYFVSFPRTGSHWLRMIMELYFEKPSLVLAMYYKEASSFTCYHRHDLDLSLTNIKNIIYLYRNPVDTVYSQMMYHKEDLQDTTRIVFWASLYGNHLKKWLFEEQFTEKKLILRYEDLKKDATPIFQKLAMYFNQPFDPHKLAIALQEVSKEKLKKKTKYDPQVVNLSGNYESERNNFKTNATSLILDTINEVDNRLLALFSTP